MRNHLVVLGTLFALVEWSILPGKLLPARLPGEAVNVFVLPSAGGGCMARSSVIVAILF